jgi:hypothetical protein
MAAAVEHAEGFQARSNVLRSFLQNKRVELVFLGPSNGDSIFPSPQRSFCDVAQAQLVSPEGKVRTLQMQYAPGRTRVFIGPRTHSEGKGTEEIWTQNVLECSAVTTTFDNDKWLFLAHAQNPNAAVSLMAAAMAVIETEGGNFNQPSTIELHTHNQQAGAGYKEHMQNMVSELHLKTRVEYKAGATDDFAHSNPLEVHVTRRGSRNLGMKNMHWATSELESIA